MQFYVTHANIINSGNSN